MFSVLHPCCETWKKRVIMFGLVFTVAFFVGTTLAVDADFCESKSCTKDMILHCMTDGSVVFGCMGLKSAICEQNKTENEDWDQTYACIPSGFCENGACTYDLLPFCLSDGSVVRGCGEMKEAVCSKNKNVMRDWTPYQSCLPEGFCESDVCTADMIPHCMTNGEMVHGCNGLKKAVCEDNMVENRLWEPEEQCLPMGYCESEVCTMDLIPHCMTDGTIVEGCSDLKNAICVDGKFENKAWIAGDACEPVDM